LLGELAEYGRLVIADLEAGVGTLTRMKHGHIDQLVVVAEPTVKSIEVARRAIDIAMAAGTKVTVVGNRVTGPEDMERLRQALGPDLVMIPEDPAISAADREGRAPIDAAAGSPGVSALVGLAAALTSSDILLSRP
jgi:CO dehydrogenase maturation factor